MSSKTAETEPPQVSNGHTTAAAPFDIHDEALSLALHHEMARAALFSLDKAIFPDDGRRELFLSGQAVFSLPTVFKVEEVQKQIEKQIEIADDTERQSLEAAALLLQTRFAEPRAEARPGSRAAQVARELKKSSQSEEQPEENGDFALNEIGNGKRYAARWGDTMRKCPVSDRWRIHQKGVYLFDEIGEAEARAKILAREFAVEAAKESDDDHRARRLKHAIILTKRATRETMLKDAASEGLTVPPEAFDTQLHLLNLENGTLDLKTFEFREHDPRDLLTKRAGTRYDPNATADLWRAAIAKTWIPDAATRDYLQECAGLSLSGEVRDEFFNILLGPGENGKSTFLRVMQRLAGSYAHHAKAETFMQSPKSRAPEGASPDLLALKGARLVSVAEVDKGHRMNAALIRDLTGRDSITARGVFERRETTFIPQFTLWFVGNHKPEIKDDTHGMWRRVRLIEFGQKIAPERRDLRFGEKLETELPGILNWALEGLRRTYERGLIVPPAVSAATDNYRAEQDALTGFINEMCDKSPTAFTPAADLWSAWVAYCREQGEAEGMQRAFGLELKRKEFADARAYVGGRQIRVWKGIRLKAEEGKQDA